MQLIIVSGRSGAGKSVALSALEDMGFYCVDNLPVCLLPELIDTLIHRDVSAAISLDIRNLPDSPLLLHEILKQLPEKFSPKLLFLDTERTALIRRYSETRRLHPLSNQNLPLENAIDEEAKLLAPFRALADLIIDTTKTSVHDLANLLRSQLYGNEAKKLTVVLESFGFKFGLPIATDYLFDVRFLPNPHWDPALRDLTGLDLPVKHFLNHYVEIKHFIDTTYDYLNRWLPMLESSNRNYLTISIGCTGGKHRSVYVAEQLAERFRQLGKTVHTRHRALVKPSISY